MAVLNSAKLYLGDTPIGGGDSISAVEEKDVNFYDYDGTLLYSYTVAEAQALTELPPAPTPKKDFLVFQEWNWTLEQIKTWGKGADVGAIYETVDGTNRFVIKIPDGMPLTIPFIFNGWGSAITIDWGDGSQDTHNQSGTVTLTHTYATSGEYTIIMRGHDTTNLGDGSNYTSLFGDGIEHNYLREAYLSKATRLSGQCFVECHNLETITIPKNNSVTQIWAAPFFRCFKLKAVNIPSTITNVGGEIVRYENVTICSTPYSATAFGYAAFNTARNLKRVILPSISSMSTAMFQDSGVQEVLMGGTLTTLGASTFAYCYALTKVELPQTLQKIDTSAFNGCWDLQELDIPASVTSIGATAFNQTKRLKKLKFHSATPPTVANANAFTSMSANCVVEVPAGSLATYQAATNYASISAQMVGV